MENKNQLKNKYVLVTGASSGIGFQIAKDFLLEGAFVGVHYRNNLNGAKRILKFAKNKQCKLFKSDFSKSEEVSALWNEFIQWSKGHVDILVNNASFVKPLSLENLSEEEWDKTFQVNLKAAFQLSRAAFPIMSKKKNGRIINISSGGWTYGGNKDTFHFGASKAALEALTIAFAKIGAPDNILVNAIRPGATETPGHLQRYPDKTKFLARANLVPLKRMAKPSEISNMVLFLASAKSSFITNTIIKVSGGE
jgi:NAD(P)-dependent dehydrogenase (short-subunit alcohol dehydrogenase family)